MPQELEATVAEPAEGRSRIEAQMRSVEDTPVGTTRTWYWVKDPLGGSWTVETVA
jgi:surface antigen